MLRNRIARGAGLQCGEELLNEVLSLNAQELHVRHWMDVGLRSSMKS